MNMKRAGVAGFLILLVIGLATLWQVYHNEGLSSGDISLLQEEHKQIVEAINALPKDQAVACVNKQQLSDVLAGLTITKDGKKAASCPEPKTVTKTVTKDICTETTARKAGYITYDDCPAVGIEEKDMPSVADVDRARNEGIKIGQQTAQQEASKELAQRVQEGLCHPNGPLSVQGVTVPKCEVKVETKTVTERVVEKAPSIPLCSFEPYSLVFEATEKVEKVILYEYGVQNFSGPLELKLNANDLPIFETCYGPGANMVFKIKGEAGPFLENHDEETGQLLVTGSIKLIRIDNRDGSRTEIPIRLEKKQDRSGRTFAVWVATIR